MHGNNENSGGCGQFCSSCLDYILDFPYYRCCLDLFRQSYVHFVRTIMVAMSISLFVVSLNDFGQFLSRAVFPYILAMIICSFLTFVVPRGCCVIKKERRKEMARIIEEMKKLKTQEMAHRRARRENRHRERLDARLREHQQEGAEIPVEAMEGISDAPETGHAQVAPVDFHHAEEPSESSNSLEPASVASDEPIQQAASSVSGSNLPRSSAEQSTQSTQSTPLENETNEEPTMPEVQE